MNSVVILFYYRVHTIIFICQSSDIITRLITITSMSNNNNRERERERIKLTTLTLTYVYFTSSLISSLIDITYHSYPL